ncbi:MAG: PQQ-dependent sugar dehydrogenase [Steroidobacteraceae bacterium]
MILLRGPLLAALFSLAVPVEAAPGAALFEEHSQQETFRLVMVADGLEHPWSLDFLPDGSLIVSEWPGTVRLVRNGEASAPLQGTPPTFRHNDRGHGMLGIALHPDFARNHLVYFCYLHGTYDSNNSRIARGRLDESPFVDVEVIFEGDDRSREFHHSGCRLLWDDQGRLFATFGDRRHLPGEAQNLENTVGKIIRINDDGSIPPANPFDGRKGVRPEIWAYGIRNVQGAALHPQTRAIWFCEHGPLGGDEVNILRRGANYGWPIATYGVDYDGAAITENEELPAIDGPLMYWRPSTAPSGLAFYSGNDFPDWRGDLFMGSLVDRRLIRMEIRGDRILFQEQLLADLDTRIRDVRMGPDGFLYVVTDANPGGI